MEIINPLVSVIVPNYNHEKYLVKRLESILNQTFQDFEIILLDDCSPDDSKEILLKYAKNSKISHCVFNETNSGNTFVQWNKGIDLAKGKYIWIAESDDFAENTFLEELVDYFNQNQDLTLVYCQSNKADENDVITGSWLEFTNVFDQERFLNDFTIDGNLFIEKFLIYKNVIPNASGVLFLKERALELGPLDTDIEMRYCGDWLFYIKLITNQRIGFVSKSLNNFRYHTNSVIAKSNKSNNRVYLIDVVRVMRGKIMSFFQLECPGNLSVISKINKAIIREHEYEKAMDLISSGKKREGILLILSFLDLFFKNYKFKKNFLFKWNHFIGNIKRR
jgi:glycosyltransferase involved in cell wall biosynthesis